MKLKNGKTVSKSDFGIPEKCHQCGSSMLFIRTIYDGTCNRRLAVWKCPSLHNRRYSISQNIPRSYRLTCKVKDRQHVMFFYTERDCFTYAKALLRTDPTYTFELYNTIEKKLLKCRHWRYEYKYSNDRKNEQQQSEFALSAS